MSILKEYDPYLSQVGPDEAYLDITQHCLRNCIFSHEDKESLCREIRNKIKKRTQLTASVGIAPNRILSKMASEEKKPDNYYVLPNEEIQMFVDRIPIRKITGIGMKIEYKLNALGFETLKDVRERPEVIYFLDHESCLEFDLIVGIAYGVSPNKHLKTLHIPRSVGRSQSFKKTEDFQTILGIFLGCVLSAFKEMEKIRVYCRMFKVGLKTGEEGKYFETYRQNRLPISKEHALTAGKRILQRLFEEAKEPIRRVKFRCSDLDNKIDGFKKDSSLEKLVGNMKPAMPGEIVKPKQPSKQMTIDMFMK